MKPLRRILITLVIAFAVLIVSAYWTVPIALSFYAARKAPAVARVAPADLQDHSVSQASGLRLSYVGYQFEVPWSDLDESKTQLYPKDKLVKTSVVLSFQSGLRIMVKAIPPREFAGMWATDFKWSPQTVETVFGPGAAASDYTFVKNVFEFTPAKMHYWSFSPGIHTREQTVLIVKSMMPVLAADTGIFNVENRDSKGFQQGNPGIRQDKLLVNLYSDDGSVEIAFLQKNYHASTGVTQPEINRIVQSLRRIAPAVSSNGKS